MANLSKFDIKGGGGGGSAGVNGAPHAIPEPSMLQLAQVVAQNVGKLQDYLAKHQLPEPSFAENAPSPDFLPVANGNSADQSVQDARIELIEAARNLADLVAGPKQLLIEKSQFVLHDPWTLQAIYRYNLVQCVPLRGKVTYEAIAEASGLELDKCRRILRFAMLNKFFCEPEPGFVAHSALTRLMLTDPGAMNWVWHNMENMFPATAKEMEALEKWPDSDDGAHTGMPLSVGGDPFFKWLKEDPQRAKDFSGAMKFVGADGGRFTVAEPAAGFDWAGLGKAKVVDMGGSTGHISIKLAQIAPQLSFVVQDLEEVIERNEPPPEEVKGRVTFAVHDFLKPQPIKDADVYFFRKVFHDWSDGVCGKILENLVPSMKIGSRLILNEGILPDPGESVAGVDERMMRVLDLQMLIAMNARQRSLRDWKQLVSASCEGRLQFESAKNFVLSFIRVDGQSNGV